MTTHQARPINYRRGPGKFESSGALGELFYAVSLEGFTDDQVSLGESGDGADRFNGPFNAREMRETWPTEVDQLSPSEFGDVSSAVGAILHHSSQGFVDVELFNQQAVFERAWLAAMEKYSYADDEFEAHAHGSKYEENISKKKSRQQRADWARAVEEGRVLKLSDTGFKSYPTVQACDEAFSELRAQGIPAQRVPRARSPYSPNARGIYQETGASQDDFVVHTDHRGHYVVDLVQRGGTHLTIGPTRGYDSVPEAMDAARDEAQRRGIRAGVIFGARKDGTLRQLGHATRSHQVHPDPTDLEPNGAPPEKYRELHERVWAEARRQGYDPVETEWVIPAGQGAYQVVVRSTGGTGKKVVRVQVPKGHARMRPNTHHSLRGGLASDESLLYSFVEMAPARAEQGELEAVEVTDEVRRVAKEYDAALSSALDELVRLYPPKDGATADSLWYAEAAYLVLMTLRGEGVGIWDGRWDEFYDNEHLSRRGQVNRFLVNRLRRFADDTGGGLLNQAFDNAAYESLGGDMEPNGEPKVYLSMSEGKFRVINGGVPIAADLPTAAQALAAADRFKIKVSDRMWNGDTGEWQPLSQSPNARGGSVDQHAAEELELYLENDARFSMHGQGQGHSALVNQLRKFRKGNYDPELAPKLWGYVVEAAAKEYCKEMVCSLKWNEMFNKPTREVVAKSLADQFLRAAQNGEFDHVDTRIGR